MESAEPTSGDVAKLSLPRLRGASQESNKLGCSRGKAPPDFYGGLITDNKNTVVINIID
jgi:hypothetical protein